MNDKTATSSETGPIAALLRAVQSRKLARWLAVIAVLLSSPSLFIGFHLDDFVGRYIYSDLEGAERLLHIYAGGYGLANGNPADNHWQIEQGYAPWWTYDRLLLQMLRPISLLTHREFGFWAEHPFLMHAHSLLWLAVLVVGATWMYRSLHGTLLGGLAAVLFAFDHTHGYTVGFISNRHALVTATFGVFAIAVHHQWRAKGVRWALLAAPALYLCALLSGESAIAIAGYLFAYALFVEEGTLVKRGLTFAPYLLVTFVWRVVYNYLGYGARGSGLYVDPVREPVQFVLALLERGPILLLGQFFAPPAEVYVHNLGSTGTAIMLAFAWLFLIGIVILFAPLVRRDKYARFWAAGLLVAMIPACGPYPHNRLLLLSSFGAMGLLAQLWHLYVIDWKGTPPTKLARGIGVLGMLIFGGHLFVSPVSMPITSCEVLAAGAMERTVKNIGAEAAGRDLVFVTAPETFYVNLAQLTNRIDRRPQPRRWRSISCGPQPITLLRRDDRTLLVDYEGGILGTPLSQLYRDKRLRMEPGYHVSLEGLSITVREVTQDGRAKLVEFAFDTSLDAPSFALYNWSGTGFVPFKAPAVGQSVSLPAAEMKFGI